MYKYFLFIACIAVLCGCEPKKEKDPEFIRVNGISIGINEFEQAYNAALFTGANGPMTKEEFIETLIKRRLLLAEAEKAGLDKDEKFLRSVEMFWQQSLLKLLVEKQLKQFSVTMDIPEPEIKAYYDRHREEFGDKTYEQKKERIRYMLARQQQQKSLEKWMEDLRDDARVSINRKLLK